MLFALYKDKSLHPPSKLLLRCLTVIDLSVGVIGQPAAITLLLSALNENWRLCRVAKYLAYVTTTTSSGVSLATLTAIGVDRLLALLLALRYRPGCNCKARSYVHLPLLVKKQRGRYSLHLGYACLLYLKCRMSNARGYHFYLLLP